jgi:hypothetical protein
VRLVQKDAMLTSHQTATFCSRHIAIVKGKVCQIASRSVGKAWQRKEEKSLEMHCIESLIVAYVLCVPLLSQTDVQKTVRLPIRG